jgi:hypothetical protein
MTSETEEGPREGDDPILWKLYRFYGSHERPEAFLDIFLELKDVGGDYQAIRFWPYIAKIWAGFDAIPHRSYKQAFDWFRWGWSADCMEPEARRLYDSLPPMITLYRGGDRQSGKGLSWTLDMETAKGFARGHRDLFNPNPTIFTARVRKSSVAFVCVDREESECVLFRPPRNITLQDTAPHHWAGNRAGRNPA